MNLQISKSKVSGRLSLPSSKSQTLRALFFASFAKTPSIIYKPLLCDDSQAMIDCLSSLGATFQVSNDCIKVTPLVLEKINAPTSLNVRNSGITFRFMTALAAMIPSEIIIDGDASIQKNRPILPLVETLKALGAHVEFLNSPLNAPLKILGGLKNNHCQITSSDSQPITALFYLGALKKRDFQIDFFGCEEKPWLELSFEWLKRLKLPAVKTDSRFFISRNEGYQGFSYTTPSDFSALAFFVSLAIIHHETFVIDHVHLDDLQPDKSILDIFHKLQGTTIYDEKSATLTLIPPSNPSGFEFDLEHGIDLLPILAITSCYLNSKTHLYNGKIARSKESDRIHAIAKELKKMGATLDEHEDGLTIYPSNLHGANLDSHQDHRIAMSLIIAATKASSPSTLNNASCINKTFPDFLKVMQSLNGKVFS